MNVGDVVIRKDNEFLRSGHCAYSHAIVVSTDPFVLVSEHADMKWSHTVNPADFKAIGTAYPETLIKCMSRL